MSEPSSTEAERIEGVAKALRDLSDGVNRYLGHLREYLGMARSDLYALRLVAAYCAHDDPLSPSKLAQLRGLSNAATTALLDRLEGAGHIYREHVEGDRRRRRIIINDQSASLAVDMFTPLDSRIGEALGEFSPSELEFFAQGAERLARAVAEACEEVGEPDFVLPTDDGYAY